MVAPRGVVVGPSVGRSGGALIAGGSGARGRTLVGFSIRCDPGGRTRTRLGLPVSWVWFGGGQWGPHQLEQQQGPRNKSGGSVLRGGRNAAGHHDRGTARARRRWGYVCCAPGWLVGGAACPPLPRGGTPIDRPLALGLRWHLCWGVLSISIDWIQPSCLGRGVDRSKAAAERARFSRLDAPTGDRGRTQFSPGGRNGGLGRCRCCGVWASSSLQRRTRRRQLTTGFQNRNRPPAFNGPIQRGRGAC